MRGMGLGDLVLDEGGETAARGRVVAADGSVWFEPPLPRHLPRYMPGREPRPRPSRVAIQADGVDLDQLTDRREHDGAVEGWATLGGRWRGGLLAVTSQAPFGGLQHNENSRWDSPPCDPPAGGWPRGSDHENISHLVDLDDEDIVSVATFRPSDNQAVLVVASGNPDVTRERLSPVLGERLCVIASRWALDQIEEIQRRLRGTDSDWTYLEGGQTTGPDGQILITAHVVRVVVQLVAYAATVPDGLLQVSAWLTPVSPTVDSA